MFPNENDRPRIPETVDEFLGIPEAPLSLEALAKRAGFEHLDNPWAIAAAVTAEPARESSGDLNKFLNSSSERRKVSLVEFIRGQRALRVSDSEIIEHARKHDQRIATELAEIIAQIA